ncbi:DUF92 domain-containing protein (plasmid) [Bacillus sp. 31A1R]|uniref:DUF92 domain-containing protein n=1 Tax=Robertmurraya mangrovi TaxID=3098077 RepID=A0ABU5IV17_9BACI|nr:DUF92 domain-containing protein [Bacillus sp. 31A1R]MDZ5470997.1 DUF92 domain-containing protein [Bacillus sp. 31A1R]
MINIVVLIFIIVTAILGYYFRLLTLSGSIAAAVVGIFTALGLGLKGLFVLGLFFASSSFWSKYKRSRKSKVEERHEKGSTRDWQQVVANGGAAGMVSFVYFINPDPIWVMVYCILLSSANSDTWASEIGTLSKTKPFSLRTFSLVPSGTSGAVSMLGTWAALAGASLIAVSSKLIFSFSIQAMFFIAVLGFLGNLIDTILGAYIQASYKCRECGLETEKLIHCNGKTVKIKGFQQMNNDLVNFLSSLLAAIFGLIILLVLG